MATTPSYITVPRRRRPQPDHSWILFPSPEPSSSAPISRSAPEKWPSLRKYRSWSPDSAREEAWLRKQELHRERQGQGQRQRPRELCRSVMEEDLDELKGCIDLGFAIDELDSPGTGGSGRWSETFPALEVYLMHRRYSNAAVEEDLMGTSCSPARSSSVSEGSSSMSVCSSGESPQQVKEKLKLWAQVVASSARQRS